MAIINESVNIVYTDDFYGGIDMCELYWEDDAVYRQGNLDDGYSVREFLEDHIVYPTLIDCVNKTNAYTLK